MSCWKSRFLYCASHAICKYIIWHINIPFKYDAIKYEAMSFANKCTEHRIWINISKYSNYNNEMRIYAPIQSQHTQIFTIDSTKIEFQILNLQLIWRWSLCRKSMDNARNIQIHSADSRITLSEIGDIYNNYHLLWRQIHRGSQTDRSVI